MLANASTGINLSSWSPWLVPLIGLATAGCALLLGGFALFMGRYLRSGYREQPGSAPAAKGESKGSVRNRDPFLDGSATERRKALRRGGRLTRVHISDAEGQAEPVEGWVLDRSLGGMCLAADKEFAEGIILSVRSAEAPETTPWIQLEVKNCRWQENRFELGCQFVRTPPWGVLLLFG
jgi:hypothetical protein